jgi:ATP-dependent RNA helicase RhlE
MNNDSFKGLNLCDPLLKALAHEGYTEPTPIQSAAIPDVLAGRDLMAAAQTGTGKTAAFALPMLQLLSEQPPHGSGGGNKGVRALILTPTRELALQVEASLRTYGRHLKLRTTVILGGVSMGPQIRNLSRNPDIVVATPGRLLDLARQGHVHLEHVKMLVLDEADRMLDMGFIHDVTKIVNLTPRDRQTLLFSATLTQGIAKLAKDMLRDPVFVEVTPAATVSRNIEQKVLFVQQSDKLALLSTLLRDKSIGRTLVFTRTKHRADRIKRALSQKGIPADSIHSNKTQKARERTLAGFERGRFQVLIGTDIVARGIDVDGISHVINYELPNDAESYVHRIGRTARAGAEGIAYSFCDAEELSMLQDIERLTRSPLDAHEDHPFHCDVIGSARNQRTGKSRSASRNRRSSGYRGGSANRSSSGNSGSGRRPGSAGGSRSSGSSDSRRRPGSVEGSRSSGNSDSRRRPGSVEGSRSAGNSGSGRSSGPSGKSDSNNNGSEWRPAGQSGRRPRSKNRRVYR